MGECNYLAEHGIKKTKQRTALLKILEEADMPLSAAQIHAVYLQNDDGACLSTTYRTLDMLTEKGIVSKTVPMRDGNAQYELNRHEHRHYAVCQGCKKLLDIENCPLENLEVKTKSGSFHVTGHRLELYGYCEDCFKKNF